MRFLIQFLILWICLATTPTLMASPSQSTASQLSYWLDTTNQTDVQGLEQQTFTPFTGLLHKGFTPKTLWVKLDSSNWLAGNPEDVLVIRVRPSFLDHITLFIPQGPGQYIREESGDMTPWRGVSYSSLNLGFRVKRGSLKEFLYLRVQSTSTLMFSVNVMTEIEAAQADEAQTLWYALTLSMIAMFWCWIFVSWLQHRDNLRQVFVIKQLCSLFYTLGFFGYYRIFLADIATPTQINLFFNITVILVTAVAFWYEFNFVSQYQLKPWFKFTMQCAFAIPPIALGLILLGETQTGLHVNMLFIGVTTLLLFTNGFTLDAKKPNTKLNRESPYLFSRPILILYYGVLCLALMVNVLAALGFNIGLEFGLHNFVLHGIASGIMMTLLLQIRAYKIEQEVRAQSNAFYLTQQQLALEQAKRDEQLQFLHMLTHELKTPLSVIDLVLKSSSPTEKTVGYANRAVADMKSIIERCVDVDRIDEGKTQIHRVHIKLKSMIEDLLHASADTGRVIQVQVDDDWVVNSDPQYLRIILGNLIENALRYGSPDQPVCITARQGSAEHAHRLGIEVSNTPSTAGWPDAEHVFTKYYRSPKALNMSGTGLGLFLVSRLATILGGRCVYAPTADQVRFILWIPN
jgi:signal transduction histidine kinase